MKRRLAFFIPILLFLLVIIAFWQMGAFNEPEFAYTKSPEYSLAGRTFEGSLAAEGYQKLQQEVQQNWKAGTLDGTRAVYFFNNPDTSKVVRVLVGLLVSDSSQALPEGWTYHRLPAREVIKTVLSTSRWIAPNPQEMYVQTAGYAQENGLQLGEGILEKHHESGRIVMEVGATR